MNIDPEIIYSDKHTFEFLVEYISAKVIACLMRDEGCTMEEALCRFQNSETFEILCRKSTVMYIESPGYVYDTLKIEFTIGTIRGLSE